MNNDTYSAGRRLAKIALSALISVPCVGQVIRGNVHNGTTGKPQPNVVIVLISGTQEFGHTTTNDFGDFSFQPKATSQIKAALLKIRAVFSGVSYDQSIFNTATRVTVYNPASNVSVHESLTIFQAETKRKDSIEITELHSLLNDSWPPRTQIGAKNLRLALPSAAHDVTLSITEPEGQGAILSFPRLPASVAGDFPLPLKPGLTKYVVTYQVPYSGRVRFQRITQYPMDRALFVVPQSMQFIPQNRALRFETVPDETHALVHQLLNVKNGQLLSYTISGNGRLVQAFQPIAPSNSGSSPNHGNLETAHAVKMVAPTSTGQLQEITASPQQREHMTLNIMAAMLGILSFLALLTWSVSRSLRSRDSSVRGSASS